MPTDGADFKRRVKYHGRTYTKIKNGSDVATVALFGTAGLPPQQRAAHLAA